MSCILYAPKEFLISSETVIKEIVNGCGTKIDFVPDKILWLVNIRKACEIHDFCYYLGETIEDKAKADRIFLNNMLRIINAKRIPSLLKKPCRLIAVIYYLAVVFFGGLAFWNGKNESYEELEIKL